MYEVHCNNCIRSFVTKTLSKATPSRNECYLTYFKNLRGNNDMHVSDGEKVSDYELKLMDIDQEHMGIPVSTIT